MLLTPAFTGLRLGEFLALRRSSFRDGLLVFECSAHEGDLVGTSFYRDVWEPARIASDLDPTPHEFRHSYITHLRAAGIDDADLARVAGHRIETMISVYTHPLEQSHDAIRAVIG